jgi:hypothetical protein
VRPRRVARTGASALLVVLGLLLGAAPAAAHEFRPGYLGLTVLPDGAVDVRWRVENTVPDALAFRDHAGSPLDVLDPRVGVGRCARAGRPTQQSVGPDVELRWRVECGAEGLSGSEVRIARLSTVPIPVLVDVEWPSGAATRELLTADRPAFVAEDPGSDPHAALASARSAFLLYLWLGVEHILLGPDHLLFVLTLLLLVSSPLPLLRVITGFTLGHSVTLMLASLDVVRLASGPVEALIALSIVLLAAEAIRRERGDPGTSATRATWAVAGGFGLLHGLGFAGVLGDLGLPERFALPALVAFNVGVEVGQVVFVLALLGAGWVVARFGALALPRARWVAAAVAGVVGGYWFVERAVGVALS